jgi:hypothetical protein
MGLKAHFDEGSMRGVGTFRFVSSGAGCFPHTKAICYVIKKPCGPEARGESGGYLLDGTERKLDVLIAKQRGGLAFQ